MTDELIKFETAKLAKEKGFNLKVYNYFQIGAISKGVEEHSIRNINDINTTFKENAMFSRPTQGLLQRWLREVHNIYVSVTSYNEDFIKQFGKKQHHVRAINNNLNRNDSAQCNFGGEFSDYEEALEAGLLEGLKLIK